MGENAHQTTRAGTRLGADPDGTTFTATGPDAPQGNP